MTTDRTKTFAALGALTNAFVWGVSWMPLRWLEARGITSLWVTFFVFLACSIGIALARPRAARRLLQSPPLWWIIVAAGLTNVCFNAALVMGDVVRAVLLFYLMPVWVIFIARWLVNEAITLQSLLRVALAIAGAALVLGQGTGVPLPHSVPDLLAIIGGFMFGLNNVLLRKHASTPDDARALAIFLGGALLPPIAIALFALLGHPMQLTRVSGSAWFGLLAFALAVAFANLALQYGAARLPSNVLSLIMISEVLFASISAVLFGDAKLTLYTVVGGLLIVSASLLSFVTRLRAPQ